MSLRESLPFFEQRHDELLQRVREWLVREPGIDQPLEQGDFGGATRQFASSLGRAGLLRHAVCASDATEPPDVRSICLIRDELAYRSGLADFVFAMQGIGSLPIWRFGTPELKKKYLPGLASGDRVGALALSEPAGGSDVAATSTTAQADGNYFVINGVKTWISNGGVADQYVVLVRTGEGPGARGLSAFMVDADNPGLHVEEQIDTMSPHALATLRFAECRVHATSRLGKAGEGFKIAMSTLDTFRPSVGATAVGLARRALDETLARVSERRLFGKLMSEMETVQMKLAEMQVEVEAAKLMVYRAAWLKDSGAPQITAEASMAKYFATEAGHRVVDAAVQLFGGRGVTRGCVIERLYRDIRPTRIYEGASEIQKLVIGRRLLAGNRSGATLSSRHLDRRGAKI
jgi:acyl-CoA dehydrogenase